MMRHLLGAAAVACAALSAVVDARLLRWEADPNEGHWLPARETMAVQALLGGGDVSPMPTAAPLLPPRELLDKRSGTNNTCAFVSGSADIPLYCATSSGCVFHSQRKAFGCCPDRPSKSNQFCEAWTTCLHSSEGTRLDVSNTGGDTMWCGNSMYPSCVKHTFAESTLQGYSLWGCGKIATTDLVLRSATDGTSTTGTGGGGTRATGSSRSTNVIQGVGGTDGDQGATSTPGSGGGSGQTQDSGPPLGAIIGGAVGGFAALAILGFAIFFLVRRSRRTGASHPVHGQQNGVPGASGGGPASPGGGPAAPVMPGSPGHPQQQQQQQGYPSPQMAEQQQQQQQQHGQYGFAPVTDPRASMAKPPYSVTNSVYDPAGMSPPHSPSPGYSPNGVNPTPSPPPPSQSPPIGQPPQPFGAAWAMPPQQQGPPGYQQNQQQQYPQQTPPQQYNAMPPPPPGAYQQHPQQFQQSHQDYAELPTGRGDRELRELA
ncbi:hypothetical protein GGTG_00466 [Gaeumannomyces tritici R3-111a-1]|uniref:Uncharacterized protein n=1 Tax=Gaeumannomyces tritici (strain R3-111a-1) TaxID=644352 RepID=J3NGS7_GAET3|nr:hypothetical protein GGTG_00466 [Gaeumannomyces tritici R3-111a-1]EJT80467.1 hypothetical protein GGTG_00466 [Gaeumannomyces tritici R3-111a-1]